ncbi:MAG: caspase family protein [Pseudomonadota bacterium]|nr:caspase family protein [Pseudomonadota bacterium]
MLVRLACTLVIAAALIATASVAHAAKRVALVIGNAAYKNVPSLRNSINDADAVGDALRKIGFEVVSARDADRLGMNGVINQFFERIEPGTEAVVYFSGHGVELNGSNYLLPTDVPQVAAGQERLLRSEAVSLSELLADLQGRSARVLVAILDACRDNPFRSTATRSAVGAARGLARVDPPGGTFVMFSAGAGELALDNLGPDDANPHGLFTRSLLRLLSEDGLELRDMVRRLRSEVRDAALKVNGHRQFPSYYDQLDGEFYFRPKRDVAPGPAVVAAVPQDEPVTPRPSEGAGKSLQSGVTPKPAETAPPSTSETMTAASPATAENGPKPEPGGKTETKLAHVDPAGPTVPGPSTSPAIEPRVGPSVREIARSLQIELRRVGCEPGSVDGNWGAKSRSALRQFNRYARLNLEAETPDMSAVDIVKAQRVRICPLVCDPGYEAKGNDCVRKTCAAGFVLDQDGDCVRRQAPRPAVTQPKDCPAGQVRDEDGDCVPKQQPRKPVISRAEASERPAVMRRPPPERPRSVARASPGRNCFMFNGERVCE